LTPPVRLLAQTECILRVGSTENVICDPESFPSKIFLATVDKKIVGEEQRVEGEEDGEEVEQEEEGVGHFEANWREYC